MYDLDGTWDDEADVVVVGLGAAGAAAAITAADLGASVLVLEKQPQAEHTPNTRLSAGVFIAPDDVDGAAHYLAELDRRTTGAATLDLAVVRGWAEAVSENLAWYEAIGGSAVHLSDGGEHDVEGTEHMRLYRADDVAHPGSDERGWGYGLHAFLREAVASRGIDVVHDHAAARLLQDASGRVHGILASSGGRDRRIRAGRGVILACGGFEYDERLKRDHLPVTPTHFYGSPANTGDGIRMAQDAGVDLWHMNACSGRLVGKFPGFPGGMPVDIWATESAGIIAAGVESFVTGAFGAHAITAATPGCVIVDRSGQRFGNEVMRAHVFYYELAHFDSRALAYRHVPAYWVFDQRRMDAGPLTPSTYGPAGPAQLLPWSTDNSEELARGWIHRAETLPALAQRCGVDAEQLATTVARYNASCRDGDDPDFARPAHTLTPLDAPPFYAVELWPGGPNTHGGPRRDAGGRALALDGTPRGGLYSAGELGSVYGLAAPAGGGSVGEAMASGRTAARTAVR